MDIQGVLAILGFIWLVRWKIYLILDFIGAFRKFVWARYFPCNLPLEYGGKWAVVTGCTDGIGKEYAKQLAQGGMNILLISRNIDKLNNVKQLIKDETPNVETEVIQVDFSHGREIYDKIASHLPGKDIGILVNNVGMISLPHKKFNDVTENEIWDYVNVNVSSMPAMTHLILPGMIKRKRGAIINIGSGASSAPVPYAGMYSATKAFVDFFSQSLCWEVKDFGITVQTLRPCRVMTNMTDRTHHPNPIVTGCTDGIGKEYAKQLARKGMNILLIARNIDKLNNVKQLIKDESPNIETEVIQVDFSHGRVIYDKIASHLPGKDIGILVNNVGVVLIPFKKFEEVTEDEIWNHVNVNMGSMAAMTHLILPAMLKKGNGAIINVGSGASSAPVPFVGIYSGTKAFVEYFSESLSWELRNTGITVQTLRPCAVITNMTNYNEAYKKPSLFAPSTETFVSSALSTLGHSRRTSGYWTHGIQEFMIDEMYNRRMTTIMAGKFFEKKLAETKEKKKDR